MTELSIFVRLPNFNNLICLFYDTLKHILLHIRWTVF